MAAAAKVYAAPAITTLTAPKGKSINGIRRSALREFIVKHVEVAEAAVCRFHNLPVNNKISKTTTMTPRMPDGP